VAQRGDVVTVVCTFGDACYIYVTYTSQQWVAPNVACGAPLRNVTLRYVTHATCRSLCDV